MASPRASSKESPGPARAGKSAKDILSADAIALFQKLGLREHLTPQRSTGFRSMVERIRRDANAALAAVH